MDNISNLADLQRVADSTTLLKEDSFGPEAMFESEPKQLADAHHPTVDDSDECILMSANNNSCLKHYKMIHLFKIMAVHPQIVSAYNDGEVISIHRYLTLATHGFCHGGKEFEIRLENNDALKHYEEGGYLMAEINSFIDKSTGMNEYKANRIVPLEKGVVINDYLLKPCWDDDRFII